MSSTNGLLEHHIVTNKTPEGYDQVRNFQVPRDIGIMRKKLITKN